MRHYDHHHDTVAETRACEAQRQGGTTVTATKPEAKPTSVVMDRLRRQAGQPVPSMCRTNTASTPVVRATSLRDGAAYAARPAHPNRIKFSKDLIRKRDTRTVSKVAGDAMLLVLEGKAVTASEIALLINELLTLPRLPEERLAKRAELIDRFAALNDTYTSADGNVEIEVATPQAEQADRNAVWANWRALAADLVKTSGHPSGARFAIKNLAGANDLSFWWVSAHKGSRGTFFKLRQVIGGGRREEVRNPQRMIDIAKRINEAGPHAAMILFGQEMETCGHCGRDLTNEESRAAGIGPVCRSK